MLQWSAHFINLELKYTWKISRNASDQKINLVVNVSDGSSTAHGEAAPNVRYQESPESLMKQFELFRISVPEDLNDVSTLVRVMENMNLDYSLRFAIESAWIHLEATKKKISVPELLNIPIPGELATSYTIPIMDPAALKPFYMDNKLARFPFIKLKVDATEPLESIRYLCSFCNQPVIVDANEAFKDVEQCIYFIENIRKFQVEFVEQPLPSTMTSEQLYLKKYSPLPLFADESITHDAEFRSLHRMFDGINVKLMKTGGYMNAIRLLLEAKKNGMKTMIGCMVESTLGIRSGMYLGSLVDYLDLDSFIFLQNEPFHLIREEEGKLLFNPAK